MDEESSVRYTVKEILASQEAAAQQRHAEVIAEMKLLSARVRKLEQDALSRRSLTAGINKVWLVGAAAMAIIVELPGMLYYLHGGH